MPAPGMSRPSERDLGELVECSKCNTGTRTSNGLSIRLVECHLKMQAVRTLILVNLSYSCLLIELIFEAMSDALNIIRA